MAKSKSTVAVGVLVGVISFCFASYAGAYAVARITHQLVNYGSFIAGPNAMSGFGFPSLTEILFFPMIWFEEVTREFLGVL